MYQVRSNMQGLNLKMQTMKSTHELGQAMGKMSKAMKRLNKQMNLPKMKDLMMEFQRQEMAMEMTQEMTDDIMDEVLDDPSAVNEEDEIVRKVLDEVGVSSLDGLKDAPVKAPASAEPVAASAERKAEPVALDAEVSDLEARLQNLRRDG